MKFLFLPYACAEKFRAAKIGAINVPLSPEASMAEFHAAKREDAMKFLEFFCKRAERGLEILKFLNARHFGSHKQAAEFLNFTPAPSRNRSKILNFTPKLRNGFGILKFTRASAPFEDTAQNFIPRAKETEARRAARAENFSKFDLTGALLNFISLPPRKFKLALLKFAREVPRNRSEILNFTPAPRKFKPAPAVRLNFALNSVPPARAAKFENGVKFKGAAKFKRGAR